MNTLLFADEDSPDPEPMTKPAVRPLTEKLPLVERLVNNITKRKRSTPQKFVGEVACQIDLNLIHFI